MIYTIRVKLVDKTKLHFLRIYLIQNIVQINRIIASRRSIISHKHTWKYFATKK